MSKAGLPDCRRAERHIKYEPWKAPPGWQIVYGDDPKKVIIDVGTPVKSFISDVSPSQKRDHFHFYFIFYLAGIKLKSMTVPKVNLKNLLFSSKSFARWQLIFCTFFFFFHMKLYSFPLKCIFGCFWDAFIELSLFPMGNAALDFLQLDFSQTFSEWIKHKHWVTTVFPFYNIYLINISYRLWIYVVDKCFLWVDIIT